MFTSKAGQRKKLKGIWTGDESSHALQEEMGSKNCGNVWKERTQRLIQVITYHTMCLLKKTQEERELESQSRSQKFTCSCSYGDPSDIIIENYDLAINFVSHLSCNKFLDVLFQFLLTIVCIGHLIKI